jgi:hypothetical protein
LLAPPRPEGIPSASPGDALEENADLEDFDPYDSTHLFWEQIKQLGFAFRDIRREDVTEEEIQQLIAASDPVWNILIRIQRRREHKGSDKLFA